MSDAQRGRRVGEVAAAAGATIRTLHHDDAEGTPVHGTVDAGDGVIWLHPESPEFGLASPRTLGAATATTAAVMVADVDAHHEQADAAGAEIVYPPVDQPYGDREYSARDPEGGLWSFMKALPDVETA